MSSVQLAHCFDFTHESNLVILSLAIEPLGSVIGGHGDRQVDGSDRVKIPFTLSQVLLLGVFMMIF